MLCAGKRVRGERRAASWIGRVATAGLSRVAGLVRAKGGGITMIWAFLMVPVITGIGAAVDISRAYVVKSRLGYAADAAGLAVGSSIGIAPDLQEVLEKFFYANYPSNAIGTLNPPVLNITDNVIKVTGSARVDATFLKLAGYETINVSVVSEITRHSLNVEVALALDTTGSMAGSKIVDLKDAAKELVDLVVQDVQTPTYSKIALVPYSMAVNVGGYAQQVRGPITAGTSTTPGSTNFTFTNANGDSRTYTVSTCVTERSGANAYTDAPPTETLLGRNYPATSNPCLPNTILPLSSDKNLLNTQIDALTAVGSTGGHIGVAWSWYLLSPNFGYLWPEPSRPAAYGAPKLLKVAVIMTDGEYNSSYCNGVISRDSTSGSGSASTHINCNAPNGHAFDQAVQQCTNMKAAGVIVYTVGLNVVSDPRAIDLVNNCATDAAHVYLPSGGTELKQAFQAIGKEIASLRISK